MNGILALWKPKGYTSHDCVMKCRRLFGTKKVGHTGTLDPDVEGVLPICIGRATKIVPFLTDTTKTYVAELKLGWTTDTEDATGEVITKVKDVTTPDAAAVRKVLESFTGEIEQVPPMYSAVKVNGRKLYEYARAGETVERPIRKLTIFSLELLGINEAAHTIELEIVCSKGTYVRTLCVDIGEALGYPAHMASLTRTKTGTFTEKNSITFDKIEEAVKKGDQESLLFPIEQGLTHLERIPVDEETAGRVKNGQKLERPAGLRADGNYAILYEDKVLAVYQVHPEKPNEIKPVRVF